MSFWKIIFTRLKSIRNPVIQQIIKLLVMTSMHLLLPSDFTYKYCKHLFIEIKLLHRKDPSTA